MRGKFMESTQPNNGGIGCFTVIQIVFLILKLAGLVNWSWWWIWAPTLIPLGIFGLVALWVLCAFIVREAGRL